MYPQDMLDIKKCTCSLPLFDKTIACVKPMIASNVILFLFRRCHEWKILPFPINSFCCSDALMEKFLLELVQNFDTVLINNQFAVRLL